MSLSREALAQAHRRIAAGKWAELGKGRLPPTPRQFVDFLNDAYTAGRLSAVVPEEFAAAQVTGLTGISYHILAGKTPGLGNREVVYVDLYRGRGAEFRRYELDNNSGQLSGEKGIKLGKMYPYQVGDVELKHAMADIYRGLFASE